MTSPEDQFLFGGAGSPSAFNRHDGPGSRKGGKVLDRKITQQTDYYTQEPLFWDDAKTQRREQLEITVQTDQRDPGRDNDDGKRRFFVKGGDLRDKVRDAVVRAGAKGIELGGELYVTRVSTQTNDKGPDSWVHAVEYTAAAQNETQNFLAGGEQNGNGTPQQAVQQMSPGQPGLGQFTQQGQAQQAPVQPQQFQQPAAPAQNGGQNGGGDTLTATELARLSPEQAAAAQGMIAAGQVSAAQVRLMFAAQLAGA